MTWSCYFPWRPHHDHAIFHDDHAMILPWSYHGEYESPWSYHIIAWSLCLTMAVNTGTPRDAVVSVYRLFFFKKKLKGSVSKHSIPRILWRLTSALSWAGLFPLKKTFALRCCKNRPRGETKRMLGNSRWQNNHMMKSIRYIWKIGNAEIGAANKFQNI